VFLGLVDGELGATLELRGQVAYWIRKLRPQIVLGHDPWKRYRLHPDHREAGWLTVDGVVAARDPHFFKDQDVPHHRPDALWLFEADEPDHTEDVTGFADAKVAALLEHKSQFETTMAINDGEAAAEEEARFRARIVDDLTRVGAAAGCTHGEAFKVISKV
jgi:LmbE family N-acetylglucosaminyl deacetylase